MRSVIALTRALWRGISRPLRLDRDMHDEMQFHIDMEAERYVRERGLDLAEARRQAAVAFGGIEKYRGAGRDALGVSWIRGLATDMKLGSRMLHKHPGLTLVAVAALSLAIGAGAAYLEFVNDLYRPTLPFATGDRLVGIQNWDARSGTIDERSTADFEEWRRSLTSFEELGAYAALDRNLITSDGRSEAVRGVEMSASVFRMLTVPPHLGRPLVESDEDASAAAVVVIGHALWQTRFAGDPGVVGQSVKLGAATHAVVGVMPPGFGFPISHDVWVPLRLDRSGLSPREGRAIKVVGLLRPRVRLSEAQSELTTWALGAAAASPQIREHLRPRVAAYVNSLWLSQQDGEAARLVLYSANVFFIALLAVCGANIATLVFARTATRGIELTVRTALGASRARIAGQLFVEAMVLCSLAAALGLAVASLGLQWVTRAVFDAQGLRVMFWWNDRLSPETIGYAVALAALAAVIVGVIPAWKATSARVQDGLKQASAIASGMRLGGLWTTVVVAQVGLTVIFLCVAAGVGWGLYVQHGGGRQLAFPGEQFVAARVRMDGDDRADASFRSRFRVVYQALEQRLAAEPQVIGVTHGGALPGMNERELLIEVEGVGASAPATTLRVKTTTIDVGLPNLFGVPIVAGRAFTRSDTNSARHVAIVDQAFVRHVLGGRDAIGLRVREASRDRTEPAPWVEIVGVVRNVTSEVNESADDAVLYRPGTAGEVYPVRMAVRVNAEAKTIMARLQNLAATVDPALRLDEVMTLDEAASLDRVAIDFFLRVLAGIAAVALLLSTAGVYALMSFTVARRTPDIAIRLALGAEAHRVLLGTFAHALMQVMLGVIVGCLAGGAIVFAVEPELVAQSPAVIAIGTCVAVTAFMAAVTMLAGLAPARRALRIQPADALKTN